MKLRKCAIQIGQKFQSFNRVLIVVGSCSGTTNALLNLINHQPDVVKMFLFTKGSFEQKYQLLVNKISQT